MFAIALPQYQRTLDAHALLDFSGVLERAIDAAEADGRVRAKPFRLEARYHHVLVDEFQDTSRAQWELVEQLVRSWGEGLGASADALPPSIFIVGDRKQSIYGFRDADVALLDEAAALRRGAAGRDGSRGGDLRQLPVGAGAARVRQRCVRRRRWRAPADGRAAVRVPVRRAGSVSPSIDGPAKAGTTRPATDVRLWASSSAARRPAAAERVADEIVRLLAARDDPRPGDRASAARRSRPTSPSCFDRATAIANSRSALERRGVPTYVYKGLGFFDADEIQDAMAVLRYLADPTSDLRAAACSAVAAGPAVRSPAIDAARAAISPRRSSATDERAAPRWTATKTACVLDAAARRRAAVAGVGRSDHAVGAARRACCASPRTPSRSAGPRRRQARENLKKLRGADSPDPESRLRDARADRRSPRAARGRRRIERRDRRGRRGQPDDGPRREGPGVPDCLRREYRPRHRRRARRRFGSPARAAGEPSVAIADFQSEADEERRRASAKRPSGSCTWR